MTTNDHNQFDSWLDAYVAGRSTPASRKASTSENADVLEAARQIHGLARQAEQNTSINPPTATLPRNWKNFMNTHIIPTGSELVPPSPSPRPVLDPRPYRGARWHVAFNVALAALVVLTIGTGIWRATDGFNGLNGGDPSGSNQQSAFAPETREWTPASSDATPDQREGMPLLPTAEECTVEPLTIDEVLWYVEDPIGASRNREMEQSATPDPNVEPDRPDPGGTPDRVIAHGEAVASTPSGQNPTYPDPLVASPPAAFVPGPASREQLVTIAEIQRMWMACVLADSPLQRWALESPELVAEQVRILLPNFASREEAEAILEGVRATGKLEPSDDFWKQPNASYAMITSQGFPALNTVALVDPATVSSWTIDGRTFQVGYLWYDMKDGTGKGSSVMPGQVVRRIFGVETETAPANTADTEPEFDICNHFELTWFPDRDDLLVTYYPHCG